MLNDNLIDEQEATMTTKEVADELGVTPGYVHKLVKQKKISAVKTLTTGRMRAIIRFRRSDIDAYIASVQSKRPENN